MPTYGHSITWRTETIAQSLILVREGFSVREIIEAARRVTGHPIPERIVERRAGDPSTLIAGSTKAKEILGWTPQRTDIETIIRDAWNWHAHNPEGYRTSVR